MGHAVVETDSGRGRREERVRQWEGKEGRMSQTVEGEGGKNESNSERGWREE